MQFSAVAFVASTRYEFIKKKIRRIMCQKMDRRDKESEYRYGDGIFDGSHYCRTLTQLGRTSPNINSITRAYIHIYNFRRKRAMSIDVLLFSTRI